MRPATLGDVDRLRRDVFGGDDSIDGRLRQVENRVVEHRVKLAGARIAENAIGTAITGGIGILIYLAGHGWHF